MYGTDVEDGDGRRTLQWCIQITGPMRRGFFPMDSSLNLRRATFWMREMFYHVSNKAIHYHTMWNCVVQSLIWPGISRLNLWNIKKKENGYIENCGLETWLISDYKSSDARIRQFLLHLSTRRNIGAR
jgi:hypothetical protein